MHFTSSFGIGLALGLLNWGFWVFGMRWIAARQKRTTGFLVGVSLAKLGLLAVVIWILLEKFQVNPLGFLVGFSIVVALTLAKGIKWNI